MTVVKRRYSAFADTPLELLLRASGIRSIIVGGVTTNGAIESTVRDASTRDFHVIVAEDCVASQDQHADMHAASLKTLSAHFAQVQPSAVMIDSSQSIKAASR